VLNEDRRPGSSEHSTAKRVVDSSEWSREEVDSPDSEVRHAVPMWMTEAKAAIHFGLRANACRP
jgi:hypothetical protein